jgi:transposase
MSKHSEQCGIELLGIDLAKRSLQLHGLDGRGHLVTGKKLSRAKVKTHLANLPPCRVAMEACGGAHYWARLFESYGHTVSLIAPQFVKPYVKSNKNDAVDAEAICEAALRPNMRYVAVKSVEQQDVQALHRMRQLAVEQRTALVNQTRGLLLEYGIDIPQGRVSVRRRLPEILEDAENGLTIRFREALAGLYEELVHMDDRIGWYDNQLQQIAQTDDDARRLLTIPGIGPMIATALLSAIGDIHAFKNGRELAAWMGLVPRQHSTGGKQRLLGISKRGDIYLRMLVIHGARSVMRVVHRKSDRISCWAARLEQRRGKNIAAVAMANKMVRMAFALLKNKQNYCQPAAPVAT